MAEDITASIHHLPQPAKRAKTDAERARAYRERKKAAGGNPPPNGENSPDTVAEPLTALTFPAHGGENSPTPGGNPPPAVIECDHVTLDVPQRVTARPSIEESGRTFLNLPTIVLTASATALAGTGITVNAWYSRSLGATDVAGWLFLAIGVGADCAALALPSVASRLWDGRQRAKALAGWLVWFMTFVFAVTAGIGFASVNIADVTASRASRVTPAVTQAKTALADAMAARDRECRGGVGKWCREREAAVASLREATTSSFEEVAKTADPQAEAAIGLAAWLSGGILKPTGHDFAMLRLILLALLPQIGGVLLMLGRPPNQLTAIPR